MPKDKKPDPGEKIVGTTRERWRVQAPRFLTREQTTKHDTVVCLSCGGRFPRTTDGSIPCGH